MADKRTEKLSDRPVSKAPGLSGRRTNGTGGPRE